MVSTVFFGSNVRTLEAVLTAVDVTHVVIEAATLNQPLVSCCQARGIPLITVENRDELASALAAMAGPELGISCGFGMIFRAEHLEHFPRGIMNIHFGNLPDIRGRHPVAWAFLLNHWRIGVSLHLVDEKIDVGELVHSFSVERGVSDTSEDVSDRIIERLPAELPDALAALEAGDLTPLEEGEYYPSLAGRYRTIQANEHTSVFLFNLFRSQCVYGPIEVDGTPYNNCELIDAALPPPDGWDIVTCSDGSPVALKRVRE